MATTPQHQLPYPLDTDDIRMGAAAIQALAEALDARLGGALVVADVATTSVPDATDTLLPLTVDESKSSAIFDNGAGVNDVRYTGAPTVVATVYAQVTWATSAVGSRKVQFLWGDNTGFASERGFPDAGEPFVQNVSWPVSLSTGDRIKLRVRQTSGGALDVTAAKFRIVVNGIAPA